MIFTTKSLIYTCATGVVGILFYFIFGKVVGIKWLGIALAVICAALGFAVATFKVPETNAFEITRKTGGENIDEIFLRWLKFRKKNNAIYTYLGTEEEDK